MRRPVTALTGLCTALVLATAGPAAAGQYDGNGEVRNILPPGSNGNVGAAELLQLGVTNVPQVDPADPQGSLTTATRTTPKGYADQLEMYDALNTQDPSRLPTDLGAWFKDAKLGVADVDVVSTITPRPGTVIKRDRFGVPHVTGATYEDVLFGSGYANIQDRMFLTDVLRHTGAATMSSFVGPTPGNLAMDQAQLKIAAYTPAQGGGRRRRGAAAPLRRRGRQGARWPRRHDRRHERRAARAVPGGRSAAPAGRRARARSRCGLPGGVRRAAEVTDRLHPRRHRLHRLPRRRHLRQGGRQRGCERHVAPAAAGPARRGPGPEGVQRPAHGRGQLGAHHEPGPPAVRPPEWREPLPAGRRAPGPRRPDRPRHRCAALVPGRRPPPRGRRPSRARSTGRSVPSTSACDRAA